MDETTGTKANPMIAPTTALVGAYVSHHHVQRADLVKLYRRDARRALRSRAGTAPPEPAVEKTTPAQGRGSVTHESLISFEDGRPYKTLRRHLTTHGLTPEAYRAKWGLPADYPMTAAGYSETRSALAKSLGLGRSRRQPPPAEPTSQSEPTAAALKRPGRPRAATSQT